MITHIKLLHVNGKRYGRSEIMANTHYNFFLKPKQEFNTMEFGKVVGNILHNFGMISFTQFLHDFVVFDEQKI